MATTILQSFYRTDETPIVDAISKQITENRMCYIKGDFLKEKVEFFKETHWNEFANSWNNLLQDNFMKDNGKYRLRRFSEWEYLAQNGQLELLPARPYVQPLYINPLNGGTERIFEPFEDHIIQNSFLNGLLKWCLNIFEKIEGKSNWEVQVFQNRIFAANEDAGMPTPEGAHRDGVTYILMMLVDRVNVVGGETTMYDEEQNALGTLTMLNPLDCVIANDEKTMHGVTPIKSQHADSQGHRDMLIAMFTKK
ncbi:2OG-Fe dioxygenase family protein [Bacillus sp. WLY-B-L8]|uniref:2OG-Fe dioxygenase family protein n=1 Tax=Bacillus multifaciens TaxID=3068506 RepID=UPI002741E567|nr:2OG-Fe dioxygenase family protein [Bacillus sp. WLY-B-L8]MDP7981253.1 2OG-Fe dioxygenase family protein [Bacillus sp. WLY-B-L8]